VIVPAGVLLSGELAGVVRVALVRYVAAERIGTPAVLRLLDELASVAARPAEHGRGVHTLDGPTESVGDYSARTGTPARTVRRWAASGRLPAMRRDGRWEIKREPSATLSSSA
jgi:hypothetical protein